MKNDMPKPTVRITITVSASAEESLRKLADRIRAQQGIGFSPGEVILMAAMTGGLKTMCEKFAVKWEQ